MLSRPLRVGLDVTALVAGDTGVARYARMHFENLRANHGIEARAFAIGRGSATPRCVRRVRVPLRVVQAAWRHVALPRAEWLVGDVDVVHSIDIVPPATRCPLVMTVHDVLPLVLPEEYAPRQRAMIERQLERACDAALVVTTCHATAAEILERTRVRPDRILVAPLGHRPPSAVAPARPVREPYLLAVGSLTPRKGFHHLVEAIRRLGPEAPLALIAGPTGWRGDEIRRSISDSGMTGRVRLLGRVDDAQLEALYRHAVLLCHPSEAEGFGIPVLEAMGYGVPVIAADIPPVREVGGDAVVLVPPADPAALAEAMSLLLGDAERRDRLARKGRARAAPLTWDAMSKLIVDGYNLAAA